MDRRVPRGWVLTHEFDLHLLVVENLLSLDGWPLHAGRFNHLCGDLAHLTLLTKVPVPGEHRLIWRLPAPQANLYLSPHLTHVDICGLLKGALHRGSPFRNRQLGYSRGGLRNASPYLEHAEFVPFGVQKSDVNRRHLFIFSSFQSLPLST